MSRTPTIRITFILLAAVACAAVSGCAGVSRSITEDEALLAGPRLLVLAPHPDDETLAAGGAIANARRHGWTVNVVVVTCGDAFGSDVRPRRGAKPMATRMRMIGAMRAGECRRACTALGVPADDLTFLGFPDGSACDLLGPNYDADRPVCGINGASRVPYRFAYRPQAPYTGSELLSELEGLIRADRPTTVLYPDPSDQHPDHSAVGVFARIALADSGYRGLAATYLVHLQGFPKPFGLHPFVPLVATRSMVGSGTTWRELPVTTASLTAKRHAISEYRSQLAGGGWLVRSFIRVNELFGFTPIETLGARLLELREPVVDARTAGAGIANVSSFRLDRVNGQIVLGVRTVGPLSPRVTYTLHARAFGTNGGMRLYDAAVVGKMARALDYSTSSVVTGTAVFDNVKNGFDLRLPAVLTKNVAWLAIGADWRVGHGPTSTVPWRLVRVVN